MKNLILAIITTLFIAACNSGGGTSSQISQGFGGAEQLVTNIVTLTDQPNPAQNFYLLLEIKASNGSTYLSQNGLLQNGDLSVSTAKKNKLKYKFSLLFANVIATQLTWDQTCSTNNSNNVQASTRLFCMTEANDNTSSECSVLDATTNSPWMHIPAHSIATAHFFVQRMGNTEPPQFHVSCEYTQ